MYDSNDAFVRWMIAGGARLDEPDPRNLAHLVALRDAKAALRHARREERRASPFARLAERLGVAPQARVATDPMTQCCTA